VRGVTLRRIAAPAPLRFGPRGGIFGRMRHLIPVILLFVAGSCTTANADPSDEVAVGGQLRDVTMQGLNTPARNLSEFRGKPLIINVWASWCGPCRAEMASLERLAWRDDSGSFTIIGVSTDDYVDNALQALKQANATITHFIDQKLVMEHMLGASRLPLTVLVAADGRVLQKVYGAREWDGDAALSLIHNAFRATPPAASH
jgi:thiol-disulfide isomerase/thioredoxin